MSVRHFVSRPDERSPALNVAGTEVTVLAAHATTRSFGITFQQGDEGTGPPPHHHDWDEAFYVLKGVVHFECDGKAEVCTGGTLVFVPRGTVHAFHYGKGGAQMLEVTGTGALATDMFTAVDAEIPAGAPDIPRLVEVLRRNGVMVSE